VSATAGERQSSHLAALQDLRRAVGDGSAGVPVGAGRSAADAYAVVKPALPAFGITRAGDLTGLDRIGIPVWFASRPNARALAVAQGKGLHPAEACISAIMEAIEGAVAERAGPLVAEFGTPAEMERRGRRVPSLPPLARFVPASFDPGRERAWAAGLSWRTGETVFLPFELVGLDMRDDMPWDHAAFGMASIGLGASLSLAGAMLHALYELVEHDATALVDVFGPSSATMRRVAYAPGRHARLDQAVALVRAAGIEPAFADLTRDIRLCVIGAFIDWPDVGGGPPRLCGGFACRADPSDAALAALLEAVQSRLTVIAGARDDIAPEEYATPARRVPPLPPSAGTIASLEVGTPPAGTLLRHAIDRVLDAGIEDIHVFPLGGEAMGVSVVRVLAPGLDCAPAHGPLRLGPRGLAAFAGLTGRAG